MAEFNYGERGKYQHFEYYDGRIVLQSNDKNLQSLYDKILSVFDTNKNNRLDADEIKNLWENTVTADKEKDGIITEQELEAEIKNNKLLSKLKVTANELLKVIQILDNTIAKSFEKTKAGMHETIMKKIQKKYPANEYSVAVQANEKNYSNIIVTSNSDANFKVEYSIYEIGIYTVCEPCEDGKINKTFDKNGKLLSYSKEKEGPYTRVDGDPVSDAIYKDITAKGTLGLPTTGKNLEKHIMQITPENVRNVLYNYNDNYGETLLDAVNGEWGLDKKIKEKVLKHINQCISKSDYWKYNKPNTKLDGDFAQGDIGDCWFLASIATIQRSPKGQKILDNTITDNHDGTYTVKFKGADKEYTVSALELLANRDFSDGDLDVKILEIAANKHFTTLGIKYGGHPGFALDLLLGTNDKWLNLARVFCQKLEPKEIKKLLDNKNIVMVAAINPYSKLYGLIVKSIPEDVEYKDDIATSHAYAIIGIDDNNIHLKNPWHSDKTIKIPLDVFNDYWGYVGYTEIP